jgi:hypothetical protein
MAFQIPSANLDVLCETCSVINFSKYFQSAVDSTTDDDGFVGPTSGALKIGSIKEVIERSEHCAFCCIVVAALCTTTLYRLTTPEDILARDHAKGKNTELWIYSYAFLRVMAGKQASAYRIGVAMGLSAGACPPYQRKAGDIQLCWEDANRLFNSRHAYGRIMKPDRIDMSLPRLWMDRCQNWHGSNCDSSAGAVLIGAPSGLLCVDVERGCISLLPPGARYCTLSYCWLSKRVLTLTKATYDAFLVPGSLTKREAELPTVIADAIHFVKELGERWIWIDSLCIIQDDNDHKRHQIGQMDKVYGSSFLGIVAAKCMANDALDDSGLARYNQAARCRPRHIVKVAGMTLTVPFESIDSLIQDSRYDGRKWTYQEWLLPRCLIFFTDSQVYFRCPSLTFCEDSVSEDLPSTATFAVRSNLWHPANIHSPTRGDYGTPVLRSTPYGDRGAHLATRQLNTHITAFTGRELTFEEDALNAFRGIQNILERTIETRFWCGLPEKYIDRMLVFEPNGIAKRRMRRDPTLGYALPSWSWAGWLGKISQSYFPMVGIHCEVIWYIANKHGEVLKMATKDLPGGEIAYVNRNLRSRDQTFAADAAIRNDRSLILQPNDVDTGSQVWQEAALLIGWTRLHQFHLTNETVSWGILKRLYRYADNIKITNAAGTWVGCILIDRAWASTRNLGARPALDFIVLSRSEGQWMEETPGRKLYDVFDEVAFESRGWCLLNVMLVERHGDCFERVAVGLIHEDAWAAEKLEYELVKLI